MAKKIYNEIDQKFIDIYGISATKSFGTKDVFPRWENRNDNINVKLRYSDFEGHTISNLFRGHNLPGYQISINGHNFEVRRILERYTNYRYWEFDAISDYADKIIGPSIYNRYRGKFYSKEKADKLGLTPFIDTLYYIDIDKRLGVYNLYVDNNKIIYKNIPLYFREKIAFCPFDFYINDKSYTSLDCVNLLLHNLDKRRYKIPKLKRVVKNQVFDLNDWNVYNETFKTECMLTNRTKYFNIYNFTRTSLYHSDIINNYVHQNTKAKLDILKRYLYFSKVIKNIMVKEQTNLVKFYKKLNAKNNVKDKILKFKEECRIKRESTYKDKIPYFQSRLKDEKSIASDNWDLFLHKLAKKINKELKVRNLKESGIFDNMRACLRHNDIEGYYLSTTNLSFTKQKADT